jgi:hypothetical protein
MAARGSRVRSRRFAQSFQWVDPRLALQKVAAILRKGGRLALLANRIMPTAPTQQDLDEINADYLDVTATSIVNAEVEVVALIEECGFPSNDGAASNRCTTPPRTT